KPMPAGKGRGVAIHDSYDSVVGMIAEVSVLNGEVKVERVVIACDCGVVVNPRGVETQLEGGMIYGLSAALFGEITVKNGRVVEGNFDTYPVVRFKDAPKTEVYITPTIGKKWGGVGEPGTEVELADVAQDQPLDAGLLGDAADDRGRGVQRARRRVGGDGEMHDQHVGALRELDEFRVAAVLIGAEHDRHIARLHAIG